MADNNPEIEARLRAVEEQNAEQLTMLRDIKLAITGDGALGITGIVATAKSAHRRLDDEREARMSLERSTKERMDKIEADAEKEKWVGRIGSGVVGAAIAGAGLYLKGLIFGNGK